MPLPGIGGAMKANQVVAANPAMTYVTATTSTTDTSTYTFSAVSIGAEASNRKVIVVFALNASPAVSFSSATIGGVSATSIVTAASGFSLCGIIIADVPTGTTGDVVITLSGTALRCGIAVYRVVDLNSSTAHATTTDTTASAGVLSATLNVPANGFAVGVTINGAPAAVTWSAGLTEDSDNTIETQIVVSSASASVVAAQTPMTVTCTDGTSSSQACLAVASWGN